MKDAPVEGNAVSNGVIRVTWENIATLEYVPRPGMEYEVADGCVRRLLRPFYDIDVAASDLMDRENAFELTTKDKSYSPSIRLLVLEVITEGDPLPKDGKGVDMEIVGRTIADFFTFRTARSGKQPL